MSSRDYGRDKDGRRFLLKGGMNTTAAIDILPPGEYAYLQNVRERIAGRIVGRPTMDSSLNSYPSNPNTILRLNDTTPQGPAAGFVRVVNTDSGALYVNAAQVASGLSGNPVPIIPFQPNQSVQPWGYVADSSMTANIIGHQASIVVDSSATATSATWANPQNANSTTVFTTYTGGALNSLNMAISGLAIPSNATVSGFAITNQISIDSGAGQLTYTPSFGGAASQTLPLSTTRGFYSVGGIGYQWGVTLTPSLLNAGFTIVVKSATTTAHVSLNSFEVTFYYTVPTTFGCTGMIKVRSDGLCRKTGIMEPQYPCNVSINTVNVTTWLTLPANTPPWTNVGGINQSHNYSGLDTQPPYPATIATPVAGATVTLTVTGTATVNGGSHAPGDSAPSSAGYPGNFIASPVIVIYAFTDASGNIIAQSSAVGAPPVLGNIGANVVLTVPQGAAQLQIGIDSFGGTFAANSGSYLIQAIVSTSAIEQVASLVGTVNAFIWGDSPHSGPVAGYLWKNPNDGGTGIPRSTSTAQATASNNSMIMDSTPEDGTVPVQWTTLDATGATVGSIPLFSPALESDGYQDFNACVVGKIFIPQGGTYSVQLQYKDQIMFGIGGGATSTGGQVFGYNGQAITVAQGLPLLFVSTINGSGGQQTTTISVTFPAMGIYQFEVDWDYWFHTGRSLIMEVSPTPGAGVALLPPLPQGVRTDVQYWAKYRASESGAQSNPGQASPLQQTPVLANLVTCPYSNDPQADKADYYRQDDGLANPTYVITGPNDGLGPIINGIQYNTPVEDTLSDLAAATNQLMQTDDFEPFPTIDTPKSGLVTITSGVITWKSGDKFNTRWLAGTLILIGSPSQNAYSLVARPLSATQIVIPDVPDTIGDASGDGVPYNIAQPILAQEPMPSMWGPDAYGFLHGCGDPYQPGAYVWTKGNNPDSAPQTNRLLLTSNAEMLLGGGLVNGISMVFSSEHAWLMYPNFADAQATTEGTQGNQWNPILAQVKRGLYLRNVICSLKGRAIAYRSSDGICLTSGGPEESLTDRTLYNLFPHENFTPVSVQVGPYTVFPPNDAQPQTLTYQNGYIYWDYNDINGLNRTLVYGEAEKGWMVDVGNPVFTCHASEYAPGVNDTAVGCVDNTVREMKSGGSEVTTSVVATGADDDGDARALSRIADVFIRAIVQASNPITAALYGNQYSNLLTGFTGSPFTGTGTLANYILDPGGSEPQDVTDLALVLSWPTKSSNEIDLWQPSLMELPIAVQSRVTEGLTFNMHGYQHVYLIDLMYVSTQPITVTLNTDEGTVSQTWPPGGTSLVPVKIDLKMPRNKWKVCAFTVTSSAPFSLYGCECWIGAWGRTGEYRKLNPFKMPAEAGALV